MIASVSAGPVAPVALSLGDRLLDEMAVFRFAGGLEDERRVGRRVLRLVGFHRLEVAGIGDDGGELLQLIELVHAHVVT